MTKEQLKAYKDIKLEHDRLASFVRELEEDMYSQGSPRLDGMPRSGNGPSNPTAIKAIKNADMGYTELVAEYKKKLAELAATLANIERAIETLEPRERTLVRLHYIEGLTWEQVCVTIGYEWAQTHRIHARALEKLRDIGE